MKTKEAPLKFYVSAMKTLTTLIFLFLLLIFHTSSAHPKFDPTVYVGLAEVNITPPVGYSHYRGVSTGIHDSLYAKAIVFGKGDQRFAVVVCDLLYMDRDITIKARSLASLETGIPYSHMMIAATHDHTSPAYNDYIKELNVSLRPSPFIDPKTKEGKNYPEWLIQHIAQAIIEANEASIPVELQVGSIKIGGIAFNRRSLLKDGTVEMNAGVGNPDIIGPAGPVDSTLEILLIRRVSDDKPIGCLNNFGLHADTFGGTEFSADFPGFLAKKLCEEFGEDFISVFANGPCGDINHINVKPGSKRLSSKEIGDKLSSAIISEVPSLMEIENPFFRARSQFAYIPLQQYSEEEVKWALSQIHINYLHHGNPYSLYNEKSFLTRRRAVKIWHLYRMRKTGEAIPPTIGKGPWSLPLEIQVFQIGDDMAIVGLPGEVFTELSMAIKEASPFKNTLVIECTNILLPYVPTEKAFQEGSYETINSRLVPGGGEKVASVAIKLLNKLAKGDKKIRHHEINKDN